MISKIHAKNFKSFCGSNEIELSNITLLSGLNSSGKSSVIQVLRILNSWLLNEISFFGDYTLYELGHFYDLLCNQSQEDFLKIGITFNDKESLSLSISEKKCIEDSSITDKNKSFLQNMNYVSASRLGPQVFFESRNYIDRLDEKGENIVAFCDKNKKEICSDIILHSHSSSRLFEDNLNAWMNEISPGIKLDFKIDTKTDISSFSIKNGNEKSSYRPTNVGFGVSYTLPIVASLILPQKNSLIVIENPEAHLHPRGQSKIAELIAKASLTGNQIVVETHSDHLIDGIRIAVKEQLIKKENVSINFFSIDNDLSKIDKIKINDNGSLNKWPDDFFDVSFKNLAKLSSF